MIKGQGGVSHAETEGARTSTKTGPKGPFVQPHSNLQSDGERPPIASTSIPVRPLLPTNHPSHPHPPQKTRSHATQSRMFCLFSYRRSSWALVIYMAYLDVHSLAVESWRALSVLRSWAMSGTRGSSGLGSVRREQMERRTFDMVSAGDHWSLRISRQIPPLLFMLQW